MNIQPKPQKIRVRPYRNRVWPSDPLRWVAEWPHDGSWRAGELYYSNKPYLAVEGLCILLQVAGAEREARR